MIRIVAMDEGSFSVSDYCVRFYTQLPAFSFNLSNKQPNLNTTILSSAL